MQENPSPEFLNKFLILYVKAGGALAATSDRWMIENARVERRGGRPFLIGVMPTDAAGKPHWCSGRTIGIGWGMVEAYMTFDSFEDDRKSSGIAALSTPREGPWWKRTSNSRPV